MVPYDNVIVTDIDGCVLYYEHSFHMWMVEKGHKHVNVNQYDVDKRYNISSDEAEHLVRSFNESAMLGWLPPVKNAIKYIRRLHEEHGFVFHAISAVPNTRAVHEVSTRNLENLFGKTAFERVVLCDHSAEKSKHLKEYEGTECYWIEDLHANLKCGVDLGMRGILIDRSYNRHDMSFSDFLYKRAHCWKEIYEIVVGER